MTTEVIDHVETILAHGVNHTGGRDGARRHAQSVIDRTWWGQTFLDAAVKDIEAAQAAVDAYSVNG